MGVKQNEQKTDRQSCIEYALKRVSKKKILALGQLQQSIKNQSIRLNRVS